MQELGKLAQARGLIVVDCGNGHIQLTGGPLLVNYSPKSKKRTAYITGSEGKGKRFVTPEEATPEQAVQMAFDPPPIPPSFLKEKRKGNSRAKRRSMLRKSQICYWCKTALGINNSTIDHVIPLHRGGLDNANNRVLACKPCNKNRGHQMPELKGAGYGS